MKLQLMLILTILSLPSFANIALISYFPEFRNVDLNMKSLVEISDKAVADGAKIIVFSEGAIDGYVKLDKSKSKYLELWCKPGRTHYNGLICQNVDEVAQGINTDNILKFWQKYAQEKNIHLLIQIPEKAEGNDEYYNTAYVINETGIIAKHRKVVLFTTDYGFAKSGEEPTVVNIPGVGEVGILICADGHRETLYKSYANLKVRTIFGLGYGIHPPLYAQLAGQFGLKGLYVDSQQYMGSILAEGKLNALDFNENQGYALYTYDLEFSKKVITKSMITKNKSFFPKKYIYQL